VPAQMKRIPGYGKKQGDNYDRQAEGDRAMTQLKVIHPRKHAAQATARRSRPEETRRHRGNDQSQHDRAVHGPAAYQAAEKLSETPGMTLTNIRKLLIL